MKKNKKILIIGSLFIFFLCLSFSVFAAYTTYYPATTCSCATSNCSTTASCAASAPTCSYFSADVWGTCNVSTTCTATGYERDNAQSYCEANATGCDYGSIKWNLGGETAGTTCCGDDSSEYYKTCAKSGVTEDICATANDNSACCNASTKCVYKGTCYANAATNPDYPCVICSSGTWTLQANGTTGSFCGTCKQCNGSSGSCQNVTATSGYSCDADCTQCSAGSCATRSASDNTEVSTTCYYCNGSSTTSVAYTGNTGVNCDADCTQCSAGSCATRSASDNTEVSTTCYYCNGSSTTSVAYTGDDGVSCTADCNKCVSGSCTTRPEDESTECSACNRCDGSNTTCQAQTGDSGYNCSDTCTKCAAGTCTTRPEDESTECSACNRCDGSNTTCQAQTGTSGYSCDADCTQCSAGSCATRSASDNTEVSTTCYYCNGSSTTSVAYTGDDGVSCTADCNKCVSGSCTTRPEDESTECGTCTRCDGENTSCQNTSSGQEGINCTTACKQCNGSGSCEDINSAEDTTGDNTCSGSCKYCLSGSCQNPFTCGEDPYGTACSGLSVCNQDGSCVTKSAAGSSCTVGSCSACSSGSSCSMCASPGYCCSDGKCKGDCCSDTDCSSDVCQGSCPGCLFRDYSCASLNKTCAYTDQDPDSSSVFCEGCIKTWDSIGGKCCGDDGGEDDTWCSADGGSCVSGTWSAEHCSDDSLNCDEEGIDCGGDDCTACNTPSITSSSDSPDPQIGGFNVTFNSVSSGNGENIWLFVCKDDTCTNCNKFIQSNCWAFTSAASTSNPSAIYSSCTSCAASDNDYWAKVCNTSGACSSIVSGGTFSCRKENNCTCSNTGDPDCFYSCMTSGEEYKCQSLPNNILGWAWSDKIGWISFSCKNQATDYLASWDEDTGVVSGYAWSDNVGWISFNCADNNVCSETNQFCSVDDDCPDEETCVDTRDGCALVSNYKVLINVVSGEVSGYAWSDSLGWLSFNRSDQKVCSDDSDQYCIDDSECAGSCNVEKAPPDSPYNGAESYIAKKVSTNLTGWGRFLSATGVSGWDGWVKLGCNSTECADVNYETFFNGVNIGGNAWGSDTIGWMSFGGTCSINYGASIDANNYELFGHAWSEGVGWLSFNRSDTGAPPADPYQAGVTYSAKFDRTDCTLNGWGKFLSAEGGARWDGWFNFQRAEGTPDYGVSLNPSTSEFSGWGWAGSPSTAEGVTGWISFNDKDVDGSAGPVDYQVTTNISGLCGPTISLLNENSWNKCSSSKYPILSWTCSQTQTGRQVQIKAKGEAANCSAVSFDAGVLIDTTQESEETSSYTASLTDCGSPGCDLEWNTDYCWRARCQADSGWSVWSVDSDGFTTPLNSYPSVDFMWSPSVLRTSDMAYFYNDVNKSETNYSKCYNSSNDIISCSSNNWTFEGATNYCICSEESCLDDVCLDDEDTRTEQGTSSDAVGVEFKTKPADGATTVSLEVCDGNNYCCSKSYDISTIRYPKWREILPW